MKLEFKYTIIYTILCLFLFWGIIKYGTSICNHFKIIENLTDFEKYSRLVIPYPKDAEIDYNNLNSPLYSHNVNLPINDPISCKNFCGPNAKCLYTGEQCTSDIDCFGCNPGPTTQNSCFTKEVLPYDDAGKLTQNLGLHYSSLTTGYNKHNIDFAQAYPGSKESQLTVPYQGLDKWTNSFNTGIQLFNKKREIADKLSEGISNAIPLASNIKLPTYVSKFPMTVSTTGQFYETTAPAANASLRE
jgi:hypothetical protein